MLFRYAFFIKLAIQIQRIAIDVVNATIDIKA